ncbi:hypothetical protein B0T17DRAFT_510702 [Bombardia bombarda]|uniref:F-box domain-containing protein n=1 Tax=Bombardia bombarda TaxID=252184 RepID=A0AA39WGA3_9PEZI|nr:hypothetical protein B0T17DRAFT_510702 [Bombardia bombarda]
MADDNTTASGLGLMDDLSTELLSSICASLSYGSIRDVRNLRLVCKTFDRVAVRFTHKVIYFYIMHPADVEMLRHFASTPYIASSIKKMYLPAQGPLPSRASLGQFLSDYAEIIEGVVCRPRWPRDLMETPDPDAAKAINIRQAYVDYLELCAN